MSLFFWGMMIWTGALFILISVVLIRVKFDINKFMGYRTIHSMASPEAWRFANRYFGDVFLKFSILLVLYGIVGLKFFEAITMFKFGHVCLLFWGLTVCVVMTEYQLRKKFPLPKNTLEMEARKLICLFIILVFVISWTIVIAAFHTQNNVYMFWGAAISMLVPGLVAILISLF